MKPLFENTTPSAWRCRKAALLLLAMLLAALCALFTPADAQSVQAMVKHQPFPYPSGVAMDTLLYSSVKTKLKAADALKLASKRAVDSLISEIKATRRALDDQFVLGQYDARRADSLASQMNDLQRNLKTANDSLTAAQKSFDEVLNELPRRVRKTLKTASPDQIATATTDYINTLQRRKWSWAGASALGGIVLGIIASFI